MSALRSKNLLGGAHASTALVLLLAGGGAVAQQASLPERPQRPQGEETPWYAGASQAFTRDSNVFRASSGEESDTISTTSLFGGLGLHLGRQLLRGDAAVWHDNYKDHGQLDNTGHRAALNLDWETIGRLSGNANVESRNELVQREESGLGVTDSRTMRRIESGGVSAQLGATSLLSIEARLAHQRVNYSNDSSDALLVSAIDGLDSRQNVGSLGVLYRPSGALTLGVAGRYTKGRFPNFDIDTATAGVQDDQFTRKDLDFTATWIPTGASKFTGRISATNTDSDSGVRDFSGGTGALQWDWRPTGKLRIVSDLSRDTGTQSTFGQFVDPFSGQVLTVTGATSRAVSTAGVRGVWEVTGKISLNADLRFTERTYTAGLASDHTTGVGLGARWDPTRAIGVGCGARHITRSSSSAPAEFDVNLFSCFAQFVLQG